jgi:Ca2+-transporting ATPase
MSVVYASDGGAVMYTKGAAEVVLAMCTAELVTGAPEPLTDRRRAEILAANADMSSRALRVLALAFRRFDGGGAGAFPEEGLVFAGLAGMIDPPRQEARDAVLTCLRAGIRPVMITGDHPETALAIARELKIASGHAELLTGEGLDRLGEAQLAEKVGSVSVYARVTAAHKLRIVRALRGRGEVVAMTGDGVNDAPAIQEADIGIAMGVTGTDVTREASDMVLVDDDFATIVSAVEEGRGIFDNIVKFVHYLLASNSSELIFVFVVTLIGWPAPLLAVQILWINLVTDSLPALGLGTEPPEAGVMRRPPRPRGQAVITRGRALAILLQGALIASVALVAFAIVYHRDPGRIDRARSVAFAVLAFSQLIYALTCRSLGKPLSTLSPFSNPRLLLGIAFAAMLQFFVLFVPFARPLFRIDLDVGVGLALLLVALATLPAVLIEIVRTLSYRRTP